MRVVDKTVYYEVSLLILQIEMSQDGVKTEISMLSGCQVVVNSQLIMSVT